jgi:DedD protein
MEVRVRERLVGALVLVAIVVLLVPAVLKGPERAADVPTGPENRSVVVELDAADQPAQDEALVPEPPQPQAATARADSPAPPPATEQAASEESRDASAPASTATIAPPENKPAAGAAAATPAWAIQLGAFSTREKADDLVANLRKRGYAAFVLEYRASGKVLHRVRVGPEQDRERAAAIAERLRKDGFQPVVAPHP